LRAIEELERIGYRFALDGDTLRFSLNNGPRPDPERVHPLLEHLRRNREKAVAFVKVRSIRQLAERRGPGASTEDAARRLDTIEADLETEAEALLEAGLVEPDDRRRYAEIAKALGWSCWATDWMTWACLEGTT
jgi:hypothetical protein